jgi:hypothetical protein
LLWGWYGRTKISNQLTNLAEYNSNDEKADTKDKELAGFWDALQETHCDQGPFSDGGEEKQIGHQR